MIVGLDVGYGYTKVVTSEGRRFKFPTWVALARPGSYTELSSYSLNGTMYWVGEAAVNGERVEIVSIDDLIRFYPLFRQHVLDLLGVEGAVVVTGLPPQDYFSEKRYRARIQDTVLWQGLGILVDMRAYLTDAHMVGILDIGFNTVDYVIVQKIQNKWHKVRVGSIPHAGLMRAVNIFKDFLPSSLDFLKTRSKQALVQAFESGKVKYFGEVVDISQYVEKAVQEYNVILNGLIHSELDLSNLDNIIMAGGGAYYYNHIHKKVLIPKEPEFANARGYIKWVENIQGSKQ